MKILLLLFWLFTKHLFVDFFFQTNWMAFNKGNWKHPGGYVHAALHGVTTAGVLFLLGLPNVLLLGVLEFVVHFVIDFLKVNICKERSWHYRTHEFWWALGVDQYFHSIWYLVIALNSF